MNTFYKLLQVLATLIIGIAVLGLLFALTSPLKVKCDALFPLGTCRMIYACLSSFSLFFVGYFTMRRLKKIVEGTDNH